MMAFKTQFRQAAQTLKVKAVAHLFGDIAPRRTQIAFCFVTRHGLSLRIFGIGGEETKQRTLTICRKMDCEFSVRSPIGAAGIVSDREGIELTSSGSEIIERPKMWQTYNLRCAISTTEDKQPYKICWL
jgi:hypothetical protein